ncbi:MAG: hypothetical protein ACXVB6_05955 [Mucilaginibacter sp.]
MSSFLDSQFMHDAYDKCIDATETVADSTNLIYDTLASRVPFLPDHVADQVGDFAGGIVHENWQYSCALPWSIAEDYSNINSYFSGETPGTPQLLDADYYNLSNDIPPMQFEFGGMNQQPFDNSLTDTSFNTPFEYTDTSINGNADSYADYSDCDSAAGAADSD